MFWTNLYFYNNFLRNNWKKNKQNIQRISMFSFPTSYFNVHKKNDNIY